MNIKDLTFANVLNIDTTYNKTPKMCKETLNGISFHKRVYGVIE